MDLSTWTQYADNAFCTEASSLGLKPGQMPPADLLTPGIVCVAWATHRSPEGDITHWDATVGGTLYTIAND
jgi:hypothetical protein